MGTYIYKSTFHILMEMPFLFQSLFWGFQTSCLVLLIPWEELVLSFQKPGSLVACQLKFILDMLIVTGAQ